MGVYNSLIKFNGRQAKVVPKVVDGGVSGVVNILLDTTIRLLVRDDFLWKY
jgi:hypothetical protein